jgi:DNA-binding transcriptional LysR family regulator
MSDPLPPPFNALRLFVETARLDTASAAARLLRRNHGAIARQVKALELWLGLKLFEHDRGRLVLAKKGREYLDGINRAFTLIERSTRLLAREPCEDILRIASPQVFAKKRLIPRQYEFHQSHPQLQIRLIDDFDGAVWERDDFDTAVAMAPISEPHLDDAICTVP